MTETGGPAWRQTIFYPFLHASLFGRGEVLETFINCPVYDNAAHGDIPYLESIATFNREAQEVTLFAVNRNTEEELAIDGKLAGFEGYTVREHIVLQHADPKAANTRTNPDNVIPCTIGTTSIEKGVLRAVLPRLSWNVIRLWAGGKS